MERLPREPSRLLHFLQGGLQTNQAGALSPAFYSHPMSLTRIFAVCSTAFSLSLPVIALAAPKNPNTDWFRDAKYGTFMHFLPADANGLKLVEKFDVAALANQLEKAGAGYFVLTLGQ